MKSDKVIKKEFKLEASKNPDQYYATSVLKEKGFSRDTCSKCGTYFWSTTGSKVCGDSSCSGGFRFFDNNPCKEKLSYVDVWKKFASMFSGFGYTPIKRYPVVARWNPTMDFTIASIAAFQPYVITGEVDPPANPLVIPQFCLRFGDIDNVGITGSHMTGFVMIGQHMFVSPEEWSQDRVFSEILSWLNDGLGLSNDEIIFHEDAWAGGGSFGPCMEFFSRGVEIGNQVYTLFEQTPNGNKELQLKVLDMGMGMERCAWFSQGTFTIYEAVFPQVVKKLLSATGVTIDQDLMKKYVPHAGLLNIDEVEDIDAAWEEVSSKVGVSVKELKEKILPSSGVFSIAEHTRSLLFALADGALPSNVGGGYNLRVLTRRCFAFIDTFSWNVDLGEVCSWHAEELKEIFPELTEHLSEVREILAVEKKKYEQLKEKSRAVIKRLLEKGDVSTDQLIELYDSQGISPQLISEEAEKMGKSIDVPDNFYALVSERHEQKEQVHSTVKENYVELDGVDATSAMYFDDYSHTSFDAKVVKIVGQNVVLDKTYFYPTSGGQVHDLGTLGGATVVDVFKQGTVIVHVVEGSISFKKGDTVSCVIDIDRRKQLAQHHTATHIINAAAKKILGNHINQAGAKKNIDKAHLDITHFQSLDENEILAIEKEANSIVSSGIPVNMFFMGRNDAEKKYGMGIYQGGAVPGNNLRIVEIVGTDVECCGGTHLHNTSDVGPLKILKASKISDGIVRITFVAGSALSSQNEGADNALVELCSILDCKEDEIVGRCKELFTLWKQIVKKKKDVPFVFTSKEKFDGDVLTEAGKVLKTQPEHVVKVVKRFISEIEGKKK